MSFRNNATVLIGLFIVLLLVSGYFLSQNPYITGEITDDTQEQVDVIRGDGDEFSGLAVFPTWSAGEPATFPLLFDGEVKGFWFFEATFPVTVELADGTVIGEGYAQAQDEWMTTDVVPYYAVVEKKAGAPDYTGQAALVLRRHNASGLPEHDLEFATPLFIDTTQ